MSDVANSFEGQQVEIDLTIKPEMGLDSSELRKRLALAAYLAGASAVAAIGLLEDRSGKRQVIDALGNIYLLESIRDHCLT